MRYLPDHGLPLVQLKEQRREMVVALQNRIGPIGDEELQKIAAIQQTISASKMSSQTSMLNCLIGQLESVLKQADVSRAAHRKASAYIEGQERRTRRV